MIDIREFSAADTKEAAAIWNRVVEDGVAFPQLETLSDEKAEIFFKTSSKEALNSSNLVSVDIDSN